MQAGVELESRLRQELSAHEQQQVQDLRGVAERLSSRPAACSLSDADQVRLMRWSHCKLTRAQQVMLYHRL